MSKPLDTKDIVKCGWGLFFANESVFLLGMYRLEVFKENYVGKIQISVEVEGDDIGDVLFFGTIKNKGRLKLVMEMIGIEAIKQG